jgi:hypothetical protein
MGDAGRVSNFYMVAATSESERERSERDSAIVLVVVLVLDGMAVDSAQQ